MGSRWSSAFSDPQVLMIDLGGTYHIDDVVLLLESAYAEGMSLRIAQGDGPWVEVQHVTNGDGGMDRILVGCKRKQES